MECYCEARAVNREYKRQRDLADYNQKEKNNPAMLARSFLAALVATSAAAVNTQAQLETERSILTVRN